MKVVLLENVQHLGNAGDVVEVKPGFGRNYLLPRGMAQALTQKAAAEIEEIKRVAMRKSDRDLASAKAIASKLEGAIPRIEGKVGARGSKLYGSITSQAIAKALSMHTESEIDKRRITIPEPIKTLGIHKYSIRLHPDVEVEGQVEVVKRQEEA